MAKPEWGTKRFCQNCGARFYDLRRDPPTCPKCGTPFAPRPLVRQRRAAPAVPESPVAAPVVTEEDLGVEIPPFDDQLPAGLEEDEFDEPEAEIEPLKAEAEEEALMEDASELGEDDDDVSEVMDHVGDPDVGDRS